MATKRIILRGISHTPSDHKVEDGGCAESLNVQLREGELTPMLQPSDITNSLLGSSTSTYIPIYIHKTAAFTNYIGKNASSPISLYYNTGSSWSASAITTLNSGESILDIKSIGNCLCVLTDTRTLWILYKDGAYIYLGDKIPEPDVQFIGHEGVDSGGFSTILLPLNYTSSTEEYNASDYVFATPESFNEEIKKYGTGESVTGYTTILLTDVIDKFTTNFWMAVNSGINGLRNEDLFPYPVFLVYAVKMAGEYVNASAPILVGMPNAESYILAKEVTVSQTLIRGFQTSINHNAITAKIKFDIGNWGDLIESVDIFCSVDVRVNINGARPLSAGTAISTTNYPIYLKNDISPEQVLNNIDNFYKIESISKDRLSANGWCTIDLEPYSQDELVTKEKLPYSFRSANNPQPLNSIMAYNNRLTGAGLRETVTRGYGFHQSCDVIYYGSGTDSEYPKYAFRYIIQNSDGAQYSVVPRYNDAASEDILFPHGKAGSGSYTWFEYEPYALLMYPDSRCVRVEIKKIASEGATPVYYSIPMKKHQSLECAYYFAGDFKTRLSTALAGMSEASISFDSTSESRIILSPNKLIQSEVDSPFIFPLSGRQNFSAKIMSVATTTVALASGQFGTSEMYVFTEDGVEAQSITDEGELSSHRSVSRDVAIASTICPIDKAIIFSTKRGVMLLEQGSVDCISDGMVGKHFILDDTAGTTGHAILEALRNNGFSSLVDTIKDTTTFPSFITNMRVIYDYAGARLILFNPTKNYQYVYMLNTGTWHKMLRSSIASGEAFAGGLNSYPDAYAVVGASGSYKILNFSTPLASVSESTALNLAVISRPLDFDDPDAYKTIDKVFLRGEFDKGDAKYLLLASNNGVDYHLLTSLRGPSWKYYRIIVVSSLMGATDKLSYIDFDVEPRFTNKLR